MADTRQCKYIEDDSMKHLFFFLPFQYFYTTRIKSLPAFINWISIYIVPTFTLFWFMLSNTPPAELYLGYMAIVLAIYGIYEAGYIQNDTETIKFESDPTLRLSKEQLEYYEEYKSIIYSVRLFFSLLLGGAASVLIGSSTEQTWLTFISLGMIGAIFYTYNHIRSSFTLILLWILVSFRYATPLMLAYTQEEKFYLFLIILLYPVLNLLDWTYKPRFKKYTLPFGQAVVRIGYYALLSGIFGYLFYATSAEQYRIALLLSIYFLLYRVFFSYIYQRMKK